MGLRHSGHQRVLADRSGLFVDEIELYEIVATADKRRFELKEGIAYGSQIPHLTHIRAISGDSLPDVQDEPLLGHPVSENALETTLYHGTLLANLEDIISQGLIPGGRRTSRKHVHFAEDITRIRDGSEIIIEVKTSAMFLITQQIYKSQAGVVLTPDAIPSSTFIRAYYNRPGGSEVWNNPRASRAQPPSSSSSGANAPATGDRTLPPVNTEPPAPGVTSKASQPITPFAQRHPYEWISQGWVPQDVWAARWEAWNNRAESQKYDTWTPVWVPAGPNPAIERLTRDNPRGVSVGNVMAIPRADSDAWNQKPTKKCPYCRSTAVCRDPCQCCRPTFQRVAS